GSIQSYGCCAELPQALRQFPSATHRLHSATNVSYHRGAANFGSDRAQNCNYAETIASIDRNDICRRDAWGRTWGPPGDEGPRVPDQGTGTVCSCDRMPCAYPVADRGTEEQKSHSCCSSDCAEGRPLQAKNHADYH